jgi:hypothetical protein
MQSLIEWIKTNWQFTYLIYSVVACVVVILLISRFDKSQRGAARLAKIWGFIGFALLLFYLLGAAENRPQFLSFFGFGALGSALGYLAGVWLAPSSISEENRFAKAQNLIATLFAGAFGTKLLSLWDDLTKNDDKLIYKPAYYLPLLCGLVGFFIALAAFYTLRSFSSGQVKISAPPERFVQWLDSNQHSHDNGIAPGTIVQFSGAADFTDDLSVIWELKQQSKQTSAVQFPANTLSPAGLLTVPDATWFTSNAPALDWSVVATSNRDRSKCANYDIHFVV